MVLNFIAFEKGENSKKSWAEKLKNGFRRLTAKAGAVGCAWSPDFSLVLVLKKIGFPPIKKGLQAQAFFIFKVQTNYCFIAL
jgi:hypothetical protein